jgi:hypothetical protein
MMEKVIKLDDKAGIDKEKILEIAVIGLLVIGLGFGVYMLVKPKKDEQ